MNTSLRLITPPAVEPVSLEEAKAHLRIDNASDDLLVLQLITTARMLVEMWIGRALITQTLQWTVSRSVPTGALPLLPLPLLILPVMLTAPQVMNRPFELPRCPVQSVTSVSQTDCDGNTTVIDPTSYTVDLSLDPARLRLCWPTLPRYLQHVQVLFVAGYGNSFAAVPAPILAAIKIWTAFLYEHRGDNADTSNAPPKVIDWLLAPFKVQFFG